MIRLKCKNCGTEMLVPKGERMILQCEKCGGHLTIIEELFKEELLTKELVGTWEPRDNNWHYVGYDSGTNTVAPGNTADSNYCYYYSNKYNTVCN